MASQASKRPNLSNAVRAILEDLQERVEEFSHLRADRILVTVGQARKRSRATTRPYHFAETKTRRSESGSLYKPIVLFHKKRMRYEITLRPLFFLRSTPEQRLRTIFHELYHLSVDFDGTLQRDRRHDLLPRAAFDKQLRPIIQRYKKVMPPWVLEVLSHDGEIEMLQWLERPPNRYRAKQAIKRRYSERDLFVGPVRMESPPRSGATR